MTAQFGRSRGITVNSIAPGPVATDLIISPDPEQTMEDAAKMLVSMTRAEERIGTTDDLSDAVLLIVQEKSRWITGQYISATGGISGQ
jgi:NAD(P)-dependent dehydrogenase (short-subunit alcohol dehydrogenase family)